LATCGNGEFVIQLQEINGKLVREFVFAVGKVKTLRQASDDTTRQGSSSQFLEGMKMVAEILKPAGGGNMIETMKAMSEMTKEDREFKTELMVGLLNNALGGQSNDLDNAMKLLEFTKTMQPVVEPQDGMMSLLQAVLGPLVASSMGGGGNPLAALAKLQQAPSQLAPPGQRQGAAPLAASPPVQNPEGDGTGNRDHRVVEQGYQPSGAASDDPHQAFYGMTINPFRQAITAGATVEQLGGMILGIVGAARQWQSQNPHPMIAQLMTASTPETLSAGFDTFCSAIPELSQKPAQQAEIKAYLTSVLTRAYQQQQEQEAAAKQAAGDSRSAFAGDEEDSDVYSTGDGEPTDAIKDADRSDGGPDSPTESNADDQSQVG